MNVLYMLGYYLASKYTRLFLIFYLSLLVVIALVASLTFHANHYMSLPACTSTATTATTTITTTITDPPHNRFTAVNCYFANITAAISAELLVLYLFAATVALPPASHLLMWLAFWGIAGALWPVVREVCMVVWRRKAQLGLAMMWGVGYFVAMAAKEFGAAVALQSLGVGDGGAFAAGVGSDENSTAATEVVSGPGT